MSEDTRTLWVGNLDNDVTDELVYELFLQTGPIEKLIFPTEGEGEEKKHKGHAYVLFKQTESVKFASQVLEGTKLFGNVLEMKARNMPITYRSAPPSNMTGGTNRHSRFNDNSSLRGGFNRTNTWHGREDFVPRGRGGGGYRHKGQSNYNQNNASSGYSQGGQGNYNYNNQMNSGGYWMGSHQQNTQQQQQQQLGGNNTTGAYSTDVEAKRQRILQQQNLIIQGGQQQQQQQQGMMNVYGMQQQQQNWGGTESYSTGNTATNYSTGTTANNWNNSGVNSTSMYQSYTNQYSNLYPQQQ